MTKKYAGIGASLVARIKNIRTPLNIDISAGDMIVPKQEKRKIPTQLEDFTAPMINTYSLETTVAEKIDAILNLMEFSSRMKDYYDIYYLANKFDFDGALLAEAMKKTFANRNHSFTVEQFEQVMAFDGEEAMRKKWKAFCRKTDIKTVVYDFMHRLGVGFDVTWIECKFRAGIVQSSYQHKCTQVFHATALIKENVNEIRGIIWQIFLFQNRCFC